MGGSASAIFTQVYSEGGGSLTIGGNGVLDLNPGADLHKLVICV